MSILKIIFKKILYYSIIILGENMNKNGFTLLEILAVVALIAIIGATTITLFSRSTIDSANEDLANKYKQIQQAAIVYVDLNESWLSAFTTNNEIYVKLGELQGTNYVSADIVNPITGEKFPSSYMVKIYKETDTETGQPYVKEQY